MRGSLMSSDRKHDPGICPTCGKMMIEQSDDRVVNGVTYARPNGTYRCYHCEKAKGGKS